MDLTKLAPFGEEKDKGIPGDPNLLMEIRGGYNRAVRAPNINELFQPPVVGSGGTADPCWGPKPSLSAAQCARTGVAASQYARQANNGCRSDRRHQCLLYFHLLSPVRPLSCLFRSATRMRD